MKYLRKSITKILEFFLHYIIRRYLLIIYKNIASFYFIKNYMQDFLNRIYFVNQFFNYKNIFQGKQKTFWQ